MYVFECKLYVYRYPQRPEEGIQSPEAGVIGNFELSSTPPLEEQQLVQQVEVAVPSRQATLSAWASDGRRESIPTS